MMNNLRVLGVDIGGSHITSAAVNVGDLSIVPATVHTVDVDNKASKKSILERWSRCINQTLQSASIKERAMLGFAMPGPFHYKTGLAMFEGNDKYENLYNVSIPDELKELINTPDVDFRFMNDATAFGVGAASMGKAKNYSKVIAVTLGTGFGSAFLKDGAPQVIGNDVPEGGCFWYKPYKEGIADDYFSTRWCIRRYDQLSSRKVKGVKEIAEVADKHALMVFREFGENMAEFIAPFLKLHGTELVILGGNISNAHPFFLPVLEASIREAGLSVDFVISDLMEDAAIIGSAKLFRPDFWDLVKDELPNL
ncbi:MAG: ROK family protein [Saprospiraceae bacterium]|nr:ROK family protein [Lewinella sp.]